MTRAQEVHIQPLLKIIWDLLLCSEGAGPCLIRGMTLLIMQLVCLCKPGSHLPTCPVGAGPLQRFPFLPSVWLCSFLHPMVSTHHFPHLPTANIICKHGVLQAPGSDSHPPPTTSPVLDCFSRSHVGPT